MAEFGGETPYSIMFGPDICGFSTKKVHAIFTYKEKNHLIKKDIKAESDTLTHVYTLHVKPDNTYAVYIDLKEVQTGSLYDDWDMLPPKTIKAREKPCSVAALRCWPSCLARQPPRPPPLVLPAAALPSPPCSQPALQSRRRTVWRVA